MPAASSIKARLRSNLAVDWRVVSICWMGEDQADQEVSTRLDVEIAGVDGRGIGTQHDDGRSPHRVITTRVHNTRAIGFDHGVEVARAAVGPAPQASRSLLAPHQRSDWHRAEGPRDKLHPSGRLCRSEPWWGSAPALDPRTIQLVSGVR